MTSKSSRLGLQLRQDKTMFAKTIALAAIFIGALATMAAPVQDQIDPHRSVLADAQDENDLEERFDVKVTLKCGTELGRDGRLYGASCWSISSSLANTQTTCVSGPTSALAVATLAMASTVRRGVGSFVGITLK